MKKIDLSGRRFGKLLVRGAAEGRRGKARWYCDCECGGSTTACSSNLLGAKTLSCGCLQRERLAESKTTHGQTKSPEYRAWVAMKTRCSNPNYPWFHRYGGRGIAVCTEWQGSFERFLTDMGHRPGPGYSLDRIDNDGDYTPSNCRWASSQTQGRNTARSSQVVFEGQTITLAEAAERSGISAAALASRRYHGWADADLFLPMGTWRKRQ